MEEKNDRLHYKQRISNLFLVHAPHKTAADVETALHHFADVAATGGWSEMMQQAVIRFGPEPNQPAIIRAHWKKQLTAYYSLVDKSKSPRDVEECLNFFQQRPEGFQGMWVKIQEMYGVQVSSETFAPVASSMEVVAAAEKKEKDVTLDQRPMFGMEPTFIVVAIVLGGVKTSLWNDAEDRNRRDFLFVIASELQQMLRHTEELQVKSFSERVDGLLIEFTTKVALGGDTQLISALLVQIVESGAAPVSRTRQAYRDLLHSGGVEANKLFIHEAACMECRMTSGFRAKMNIFHPSTMEERNTSNTDRRGQRKINPSWQQSLLESRALALDRTSIFATNLVDPRTAQELPIQYTPLNESSSGNIAEMPKSLGQKLWELTPETSKAAFYSHARRVATTPSVDKKQ